MPPRSPASVEALLREVGRRLSDSPATGVREKAPADVVSDLDLWAEATICDHLRDRFPGDTILSEESASSVAYGARVWVLDPLDGTLNRTTDVPFFAISLALLEHGHPTEAYVYDPIHDELFTARAGQGAWVDGSPIHVREDGVRGLCLTSGLIERLARAAPADLVQILSIHGKVRNFGAQALHLSYVACGRISAAAGDTTRLWDNLAGALLVREAGGRYTDLEGRDPFPLQADTPALAGAADPCLAGAPDTHAALLPLLRTLTK